MGFGPASRRGDQAPALAVIGRAFASEFGHDPSIAKVDVDAVLVELHAGARQDSVEAAMDVLEGRVWGLSLDERAGPEVVAAAKERGCDFLSLDELGAPVSLLSEEGLGKLVSIQGDVEERTAGAIRGLGFDGALYLPADVLSPLTLGRLIAVQTVHRLFGDPFLVFASGELTQPELKELRDAGIAGIVVELSDADNVARMRDDIRNLPKRRPRAKQRRNVAPLAPSAQQAHEEVDDYGDGCLPD